MTAMTTFAKLFEPLPVGGRTARNRIVHAPMSVCYGDENGYVTRPEVEHYGRVLRVATRAGADPAEVARSVLAPAGIALASLHEARITVEDAFVSMVRAEDRPQ